MPFDLSTAKPVTGGFDLSTAMPVDHPAAPKDDDSPFVKGIKDALNETGRVAAKTVTGPALMGADIVPGIGNLISKMGGGDEHKFRYPSDIYNKSLDSMLPAPTSTAGKWSEGLSTLLASLGKPELGGIPATPVSTAPNPVMVGADSIKAKAMADARNSKIVIPPTLTKDAPMPANLANGFGGLAETLKKARDINTPQFNAMGATDIGLDEASPLSTSLVKDQIKGAIDKGYGPIAKYGDIPVDQAHLDYVRELAKADRGAARVSPLFSNPQIAGFAEALMPNTARTAARKAAAVAPPSAPEAPSGAFSGMGVTPAEPTGLSVGAGKASPTIAAEPSFNPRLDSLTLLESKPKWDSGDLIDSIQAIRAKASDAYAQGNPTLGAVYRKGANSLESLIDRHLQNQGEDAKGMLDNFRASRTIAAKGHDVLAALNKSTGDVDPRVWASIGDDSEKLTGGIGKAANIARAFPDAAVPSKGTPSPITAFQVNSAEGASNGYGLFGSLIGRPLARNYALSERAQNALMQPKGKTLNRKALDAIFANPTAFASMYEDANNQ